MQPQVMLVLKMQRQKKRKLNKITLTPYTIRKSIRSVFMIGNVDLDLLEKTYQNASIGITALKAVMDKVDSKEMNKDLHKQIKEYRSLADKSKDQLIANGTKVKEQSFYIKTIMKGNVNMNTLINPSDSRIAQMVIQGSTMGFTQMTKLLHAKKDADGMSTEIAMEFIKKEETNIENMKKYL